MVLPALLLGFALAAPSMLALPALARPAQEARAARPAEESDALVERARRLFEEAREAYREAESATARAKSVEAIDALLAGGSDAEAPERLELLAAHAKIAKDAGDLDGVLRACEHVLEVRTRTLPEDALELQIARLDLAAALEDRGALKEARELTERALAVLERTAPEEHPERLRAGNTLGVLLNGLRDFEGALAVLESVLAVRMRVLPAEHEDVLKSKQNLAISLARLGDLEAAREIFVELHDIRSRTLPDDHLDLQTARQNLASILRLSGEFDSLRALDEKVLEVRSRTLPEDHPGVQAARIGLASTLTGLGDYASARKLEDLVLQSLARHLPEDHPEVLDTQKRLAEILQKLGDFQGSRELMEHVLAVLTRTLPADHPEVLDAYSRLGNALRGLGDLTGARELHETALLGLSRVLPEDSTALARQRMEVAVTLKALGELQAARSLEERGLEVLSKALPADHPDLNKARSNLGATLAELGDSAGARALYERAIAGYARTAPGHAGLVTARINLALLLDSRQARALQEEILAQLSASLPEDHPLIQTVRGHLAWTLADLGEWDEARAHRELALEVSERKLPAGHRAILIGQHDLARTLRRSGELEDARVLLERALDDGQHSLPPGDRALHRLRRDLALTLAAEAAVAAAAGSARPDEDRSARCAELLRTACDEELQTVRELLLSSSGREVEEVSIGLPVAVSDLLSFARGCGVLAPRPELVAAAFLLSETTRGAAVQSASLARAAAGTPKYEAARAAWSQASAELAALGQAGASSEAFDAARARREGAERRLVALAREVPGAISPGATVSAAALRARLDERTALVVFRWYKDWIVEARTPPSADGPLTPWYSWTARLGAFVLRGAATPAEEARGPAFVDLGPRKDVRLAAEAWRSAVLSDRERGVAVEPSAEDPTALGAELRRLVFDPLRAELGDAERIVLVLDDVLHLVPLEALPLGEGEGLLGDRWRMETRVTSSELLAEDVPLAGGTLVALGGASFNLDPLDLSAEDSQQLASEQPTQVATLLRGTTWERGFEPLTHTADEARGVGALYEEAFEDARALVLEKRKASRSALLTAAPSARFLHVATHGWYAPESIRSWADDDADEEDEISSLRASSGDKVRRMSPMLLSGLALAGANLPEDGAGRAPGLVTAEELAAFDLRDCELAVLSACDTNVGESRVGQGVASFQRGLQMAGARSVITSLWKVPDEATKELMLDFYRRLWVQGQPKGEALWAAKRRLREARDESGRPKYALRDWAGWVLTGRQD